jgi:hypothetical protein
MLILQPAHRMGLSEEVLPSAVEDPMAEVRLHLLRLSAQPVAFFLMKVVLVIGDHLEELHLLMSSPTDCLNLQLLRP